MYYLFLLSWLPSFITCNCYLRYAMLYLCICDFVILEVYRFNTNNIQLETRLNWIELLFLILNRIRLKCTEFKLIRFLIVLCELSLQNPYHYFFSKTCFMLIWGQDRLLEFQGKIQLIIWLNNKHCFFLAAHESNP